MAIQLVAHRGYPRRYPENTQVGFEAAWSAGARWLETDIQLSRDQVPMLYHDGTLQRTSERRSAVWDLDASELSTIDASFRERFGDQFSDEPIMTLAQFVGWAQTKDNVELLIELKKESLKQFGGSTVVSAVLSDLEPIADQCTIISKDDSALRLCREQSSHRIGWVVPKYDADHQPIATELSPDFLICKGQRIPPAPTALWEGNWQWMVYPINDPQQAVDFAKRGINFIETDDIGMMTAELAQ